MDDSKLTRIGPGIYMDEARALFVNVSEFLVTQKLPDVPEVRQAVLEQIRHDFGGVEITELPGE
jgi:hypothetical protein